MAARTLLFDIDGTLVLFPGLGRAAMSRAMEEVWGLEDALDGVSFAGATDSGIAARVGPGLARAPMWARYLELFEEAVAGRTDLVPLRGAAELVGHLRGNGTRLGLLTGNLARSAEIKLRTVGLLDHFDRSVSAFAEDGEAREEIAAAARARCGDGPLTIVGDSVPDIRCARHIGARVLAVATGPTPRADLAAAAPDRLVDDLADVPDLADWLLA